MGTLSDRILGQIPEGLGKKDLDIYTYYDGFADAGRQAANLAKEADELMGEMVEVLDVYADERYISLPARQMINKYNRWKEQNQ